MNPIKKILLFISLTAMTISAFAGTFVDSRDGKKYKTVQVGSQLWMAQNMNYAVSESACYDNEQENCRVYGRLYSKESAKNACPSGWTLPRESDFETLKNTFKDNGSWDYVKSKMGWLPFQYMRCLVEDEPCEGIIDWETDGLTDNNGNNKTGLSVVPAGIRNNQNKYEGLGFTTAIWSADESYCSFEKELSSEGFYYDETASTNKYLSGWYSVRCVKK